MQRLRNKSLMFSSGELQKSEVFLFESKANKLSSLIYTRSQALILHVQPLGQKAADVRAGWKRVSERGLHGRTARPCPAGAPVPGERTASRPTSTASQLPAALTSWGKWLPGSPDRSGGASSPAAEKQAVPQKQPELAWDFGAVLLSWGSVGIWYLWGILLAVWDSPPPTRWLASLALRTPSASGSPSPVIIAGDASLHSN